nr:SCO2322 family protein [Streptomyces alkaliphilus]
MGLGAGALVPQAAALQRAEDTGGAEDTGNGRSGTGYRYWSFWELDENNGPGAPDAPDGSEEDGEDPRWRYSTRGPGTLRPLDGDVLGMRFAVTVNSGDARAPRGDAEATSFGTICAGEPAGAGTRRVALVVDFGVPADAPDGETPPEGPLTVCARVPDGGTAADALADTAGPLRYAPNGLLCAISGYPRRGCGEAVALDDRSEGGAGATPPAGTGAPESPDAPDAAGAEGGGAPPATLLLGAALVALLAVTAVLRARRRRP